MKKLVSIIFLFSCLQLFAQDTRTLGSTLYGDLYLGLMFTGEYASGSGGLGFGYRFNDQHAVGLLYHGFTEASISTTRSATCIGLQYRYELQRWAFDASTGYVRKFRYVGDDPFLTETVHEESDPWYYRLGVRRQMFGMFYLGLSYAQSGRFVIKHTNIDYSPPEIYSYETLGVHAITLNFGLLLQQRNKN